MTSGGVGVLRVKRKALERALAQVVDASMTTSDAAVVVTPAAEAGGASTDGEAVDGTAEAASGSAAAEDSPAANAGRTRSASSSSDGIGVSSDDDRDDDDDGAGDSDGDDERARGAQGGDGSGGDSGKFAYLLRFPPSVPHEAIAFVLELLQLDPASRLGVASPEDADDAAACASGGLQRCGPVTLDYASIKAHAVFSAPALTVSPLSPHAAADVPDGAAPAASAVAGDGTTSASDDASTGGARVPCPVFDFAALVDHKRFVSPPGLTLPLQPARKLPVPIALETATLAQLDALGIADVGLVAPRPIGSAAVHSAAARGGIASDAGLRASPAATSGTQAGAAAGDASGLRSTVSDVPAAMPTGLLSPRAAMQLPSPAASSNVASDTPALISGWSRVGSAGAFPAAASTASLSSARGGDSGDVGVLGPLSSARRGADGVAVAASPPASDDDDAPPAAVLSGGPIMIFREDYYATNDTGGGGGGGAAAGGGASGTAAVSNTLSEALAAALSSSLPRTDSGGALDKSAGSAHSTPSRAVAAAGAAASTARSSAVPVGRVQRDSNGLIIGIAGVDGLDTGYGGNGGESGSSRAGSMLRTSSDVGVLRRPSVTMGGAGGAPAAGPSAVAAPPTPSLRSTSAASASAGTAAGNALFNVGTFVMQSTLFGALLGGGAPTSVSAGSGGAPQTPRVPAGAAGQLASQGGADGDDATGDDDVPTTAPVPDAAAPVRRPDSPLPTVAFFFDGVTGSSGTAGETAGSIAASSARSDAGAPGGLFRFFSAENHFAAPTEGTDATGSGGSSPLPQPGLGNVLRSRPPSPGIRPSVPPAPPGGPSPRLAASGAPPPASPRSAGGGFVLAAGGSTGSRTSRGSRTAAMPASPVGSPIRGSNAPSSGSGLLPLTLNATTATAGALGGSAPGSPAPPYWTQWIDAASGERVVKHGTVMKRDDPPPASSLMAAISFLTTPLATPPPRDLVLTSGGPAGPRLLYCVPSNRSLRAAWSLRPAAASAASSSSVPSTLPPRATTAASPSAGRRSIPPVAPAAASATAAVPRSPCASSGGGETDRSAASVSTPIAAGRRRSSVDLSGAMSQLSIGAGVSTVAALAPARPPPTATAHQASHADSQPAPSSSSLAPLPPPVNTSKLARVSSTSGSSAPSGAKTPSVNLVAAMMSPTSGSGGGFGTSSSSAGAHADSVWAVHTHGLHDLDIATPSRMLLLHDPSGHAAEWQVAIAEALMAATSS